jgi:hypothetical protein
VCLEGFSADYHRSELDARHYHYDGQRRPFLGGDTPKENDPPQIIDAATMMVHLRAVIVALMLFSWCMVHLANHMREARRHPKPADT